MPQLAMGPMIPYLSVGGRIFTDLANLIVLIGRTSTTNRYSTGRLFSASSGYQVTAAKTLKIMAGRVRTGTASNEIQLRLGYGDTDVGQDSSSAPTNPVWNGGDTSIAQISVIGTVATEFAADCYMNIPATKYPCIDDGSTGGGCSYTLYGYEV